MDIQALRTANPDHWNKAAAIRTLTLDAIAAANSGHSGMPMGMADVATVLFEKHMKFDAKNPTWPDRDRFILSAGHGSMLIHSPSAFMGNVDSALTVNAGLHVYAQGHVFSNCGGHVLAAKKDFDIKHPSKEGWRLRYVAPEAPSADVYCRGRVTNKTEIVLPLYWKDLVDWTTITVNLTPIGAHQDVIVKRIDEEKVYLQAMGGMPINCFYHIYGERQDCERNIAEYEGESPADYPGDNSQYLQSGG